MPSPITKPNKNVRSRRLSGTARPMQTEVPIGIMSATTSGSDVILVFNQFVSLKGIPQYPNSNGAMPAAASMANPTTLVLTYPVGPAATGITIPGADPSIRNASGGYVSPTAFPV
jgi:hypothetical protein